MENGSELARNIGEVIKARRSVYPKMYTAQTIPEETILAILEMANHAPTHKRTEPWRFKVFHSQDARTKLSQFLGDAFLKANEGKEYPAHKYQSMTEKPLQSGCVLAVCMQRDPKESLPEWEEMAAVACAVQNMWLYTSALGIGAYWSTPSYILNAGEFLQLREGERCLGLFYMGYTEAVLPPLDRGDVREKVTFV